MPTTIDFYILKNNVPTYRLFFACRLLEKAYRQSCSVFVSVDTPAEAQQLHDLLWTFQDISFIPHTLQGKNSPAPIVIGQGTPEKAQILLNLTSGENLPMSFNHFERVMEIVPHTEPFLQQSRTRYRDYRAQGCELRTHTIES